MIEELFRKLQPQDGECPEWAKELCLEFGKRLLEEAAENALLRGETAHNNGAKDVYAETAYEVNKNGPDYIYRVDKGSIMQVLNKYQNHHKIENDKTYWIDSIEYNGYTYWYQYKPGKKGDICLATKEPKKYCNGFYWYSPKDPGNGMAFVIVKHNNPNENWFEN